MFKRSLYLIAILFSLNTLACDDEAYRDFDFWLGDWQVFTPDGKLAGNNRITVDFDQCVIREQYSTPRGYRGESLNIYNKSTSTWHQTWVDNTGLLLQLKGGIEDGSMVLEGKVVNADESITVHRITWTANPDNTVRQLWQTKDGDLNDNDDVVESFESEDIEPEDYDPQTGVAESSHLDSTEPETRWKVAFDGLYKRISADD